ncbi:MAG: aspartate/glutamate racemase family protein [Deltaproteobacteria bacterium]|nr:aspartate/glutamate racemase family protein [Deltaproteobacteria bacterium]
MNQCFSDRHIALMDSGLGLLTLIPHLEAKLPGVRMSCLSDQACFPYGNRSGEQIRQRLCHLAPLFVRKLRPDILILACNTASTAALAAVRDLLPIPVIGVVPAIRPAAEQSRSGITAILATTATVNSPYTAGLIREHAGHCRVLLQGSDRLALAAESFRQTGQKPDLQMIRQETHLIIREQPDTVALACTHFPLILDLLRQVMPFVRVWTEPGPGVARQAERLLASLPAPSARPSGEETRIRFFTTKQNNSGPVSVPLSGYDDHNGFFFFPADEAAKE